MIHALEIAILLALITGAGAAIGMWLGRDRNDAPLGIGWAFLLGAAFVGGVLHIPLALFGTLPRYAFAAIAAMCGGMTLYFMYHRLREGNWLFERRRGWLFDLPFIMRWAACVALFVGFSSATVTPPVTYDGRAAFLLKARVLYDTGTIRNEDFNDVDRLHFNSHYPLLGSLLESEMFWAEGCMDDTSIRLLFAMFLASLLTVVTGELRLHIGKSAAAKWGLFLLAMPYVVSSSEGGGLSTSVDMPLACFVTAAAIEFAHWLKSSDGRRGLTAGLMMGAACLTKSEGTIWLVAMGVGAAIALWKKRNDAPPQLAGARWRTAVPGGIVLFGLLALSTLARQEIPFSPYLRSYGQAIRWDWLTKLAHRPIEMAPYVVQEMLNLSRWTLFWPCLLGGVLFLRRRTAASPELRFLQIVPLLMAAIYLAIFLITPYHVQFHLRTALCRLMLHFLPLAVMGLAEHIHSSGLLANISTLAKDNRKDRLKRVAAEIDIRPIPNSDPTRRKAG